MDARLLQARKEVEKIKQATTGDEITIDFLIDFTRSKTDLENLVGYGSYIKALADCDGDVQLACELSGISIESVINRNHNNFSIPVVTTKLIARKLLLLNQN